MTKQVLLDALVRRTGLPRAKAVEVVDALFAEDGLIADALADGRKVQIAGFGTFEVRHRAGRRVRNPRTGEPLQVASSKVPAFRAGAGLKTRLVDAPVTT